MFYRFINLLRAMLAALYARVENPELMLEHSYHELQANLIELRQAVAPAIATEKQLERQLRKLAGWQQNNAELAERLIIQREKIAELKRRISELETEIHRAYTKRQVLIARDKAAGSNNRDFNRGLIFIVAALILWAVIGAGIGMKHAF